MGLYLCVFRGDEEIDGVEVGSYDDFGFFRDAVRDHLEAGQTGTLFPVLMLHSDCDGSWSPHQAKQLVGELRTISESFSTIEPVDFNSDWQRDVAKLVGLRPRSLKDCFIDVDGEPLIERIIELCETAIHEGLPILFQ
ncbi:MAG: hypothetical protein JSV16_03890 [Candidatus Hydrogenedentota bacterium]|nr:MAG: hypothetical protein JSV16_03890 [Candidatus Hydrogenedentota bacterium]